MASLPFVDTHVHFWDLQDPELHYSWLQPDWIHPILGDINGIKVQRYSADQYIAETRFQNVSKAVHVQAAIGIADPTKETAWLQVQADRTGFPHGIVGHVDLAQATAEEVIGRHLEYANFRGVRDFAAGELIEDSAWRRGYGLLTRDDLVFCIDTTWEAADQVRGLAAEYDDVVLSIDHAVYPRARTDEYFENWKRGLRTFAEAPNIVMKISGLGMRDNQWTVESMRPWVLSCIELFGVERCFFGTNWPVDSLYSSFGDVVDAYDEITADFTPDERTALFSRNAERIFRV
jgi:predicted TIM-barrel fold metal-dependent hydrolase